MRVSNPLPYLDIHTTNAVVRVEREPIRLTAEHQRAQMHVDRTRPTFKVNWKKLRPENGARNTEAQRQYASRRRQQILQRGNSLSDITQSGEANPTAMNPADVVASLTISRSSPVSMSNVSVAGHTMQPAKIDWDPGSLEINWDPYKLEMSWEGDMRPKVTVTPHTVEIRLINGKTIRVGENEAKAIEMQGYGKRMDEQV